MVSISVSHWSIRPSPCLLSSGTLWAPQSTCQSIKMVAFIIRVFNSNQRKISRRLFNLIEREQLTLSWLKYGWILVSFDLFPRCMEKGISCSDWDESVDLLQVPLFILKNIWTSLLIACIPLIANIRSGPFCVSELGRYTCTMLLMEAVKDPRWRFQKRDIHICWQMLLKLVNF